MQAKEEKIAGKATRNNRKLSKKKKEVKKTRGTQNKCTMFCRNKDGMLLGDKTEKLNRCAEYFGELLNDKGQTETEMQQRGQEIEQQIQEAEPQQTQVPTEMEIITVIKDLKNNKNAGESEVPAEILKLGGNILQQKIADL
uniref:Uncharacterized protein LOC114345420 n=1 Tax=Diabrotica virgifera virgifera TaxID=50390 RepID=A0A6P7GQ63_DIAVI